MKTVFDPTNKLIDAVDGYRDADTIREEPMVFSASIDFAHKNGGPITKGIIETISNHEEFSGLVQHQASLGYHPIIDTKVTLLQPGMAPCIPGWHCDGVIRPKGSDQPDLDTLSAPIAHYIVSISNTSRLVDHCGTEIMTQKIGLDVDEKRVWGSVNEQIPDDVCVYVPRPGEIVQFSRATLHRGQYAKVSQWRYFFRLSFYHMPAANEIRNQVQVYTDPNTGW